MNRQQLLSRLATRGWPVTYSCGPLSIWSRGTDKWDGARLLGRFAHCDAVQVDFPGRFPPSWPTLPLWDNRVVKWHARRLRKSVNSPLPLIAYVFEPRYQRYIDALSPAFIVYHPYDAFSLTPGWNRTLSDAERDLVNRADLVVASSSGIAAQLPDDAKQKVLRELPNAADFTAYKDSASLRCPADLEPIPHPRIGYTGAIGQKVDLKLVADIAQRKPAWNWVLIGPLRRGAPGEDQDWAKCLQLRNIHYLGVKDFRQLPAYVGNMDVNVMCYRSDGGWWQRAYPLKTHEYLASGKPVVSCYLEDIQEFSGAIAFATGTDEWVGALGRALDERDDGARQRRQEIASQNSWDKRVDLLETWLLEMTMKKAAL